MTDFFLQALLAGLLLVTACAPLGALVVWRRMAYFGDAMAHGALFGVALGLILGVSSTWSILLAALVMALLLMLMERDHRLPVDGLLGLISTGGLALGLVLYHLMEAPQGDLFVYLFGDILAVGQGEIWLMAGVAAFVVFWAWKNWTGLVLWVLHSDMAEVEGVPVDRLRFTTTMLLAAVIALAIKVVGVLLVTSMLVVPALTVSALAHSPRGMVIGAWISGLINIVAGLALSYYVDVPTGPAIVVMAVASFAVVTLVTRCRSAA